MHATAVRPLVVLGVSDRHRVSAYLHQAIESFREATGIEGALIRVEAVAFGARLPAEKDALVYRAEGGIVCAFRGVEPWQIGAQAMHVPVGQRTPLLSALGERLLCHLAASIAGTESSQGHLALEPGTSENDWVCVATLGLGPTRTFVSISGSVFRKQIGRTAAMDKQSLVGRISALGREKVSVGVGLKPTSIKLSELADLHVGDVLVTEHLLDAPLIVSVEGAESRVSGALVRVDGRRAVVFGSGE